MIMVKIPGLDDLKKMGSDLMDSAKTVKLGGMVDKIKTGIESVGKKGVDVSALGDDPLGKLILDMSVVLDELETANATQAATIRKMQNQLVAISKVAVTYQKPVVTETPTTNPEDDKKL
jgi:hypothetical protein